MSTAEQIAVPDFIRDNKCRFRNGKSAEVFISAKGGIVAAGGGYLGIQNPDGSAVGDHREYDLVPVAEERPREPRVWTLLGSYDGEDVIASGPDLALSETVRVTELPDGWEVRRKPTPEWRYFKMGRHSWKSDGVTTLYKGSGDWVDSVASLAELIADRKITETDAAGRPVEKP